MNQETIKDLITQAVNACQNKNASVFASLFTSEAIMILTNGKSLKSKEVIYQVTEQYFAQLKSITIKIEKIQIEKQQALVEWHWQNDSLENKETKLSHNLIRLEFTGNLINFWQEEKLRGCM